jgi:hypothetical protein
MAKIEIKVNITDLDLFIELIDYLKDVILHDKRMPGGLANEMQEKIGNIIKECRKR